MLKLIRYDLRRRRDQILAAFAILVVLQVGIWISASSMGKETVSIHLTAYLIVGIVFLFNSAIAFNSNLKSYPRRLLPVSALYTVLSPLLLFWMLLIAIVCIILLHLGIYTAVYSADWLPGNFWPIAIRSTLQSIWSAGLILIMIMFSCTVSRSIRFRGRLWIGIAVLVLLQNGVAYLEQVLFDSYFIGIDNAFRFEVIEASDMTNGLTLNYVGNNLVWEAVFEIALAAVMIYVMTVLVKKKVEL